MKRGKEEIKVKQSRFAKLANCEQSSCTDKIISEALDKLVRALQLINGSVKIYVHQGKWGARLEIVNQVNREIK